MQPAFRAIQSLCFTTSLVVATLVPANQAALSALDTLIDKIMMENPILQKNIQPGVINGQNVFLADTKESGSQLVSELIIQTVQDHHLKGQMSILGLATGSTPLPVYRNLVSAFQDGVLPTRHLTTFNLDEYQGLSAEHPASYAFFMYQNLFRFLDIPDERRHIPSGTPDNMAGNITGYQQLLNLHPRDIQLLGLGQNGHIAFNEPGSLPTSRTRLVQLDRSTRIANSRYFDNLEQVPGYAITMGIADILEAKVNIVMAWGEKKADTVARAMTGAISPDCPASFMQQHKGTIWVVDQLAGEKLKERSSAAH